MRLVRISWLIALMLVATTLPPGAWAVPIRQAADQKQAAATPKPTPIPARSDKTDPARNPDRIRIAPNTEMWDGSSTRAAGTVSGLVLLDVVLTEFADGAFLPVLAGRAGSLPAPQPVPPRWTGWLIGHYAHAPPLA